LVAFEKNRFRCPFAVDFVELLTEHELLASGHIALFALKSDVQLVPPGSEFRPSDEVSAVYFFIVAYPPTSEALSPTFFI
jgi:hypothetical protein